MVSSPSPPNPYRVAEAQSAANVQAAIASGVIGNVNETNPYGTVNYNKVGETRIEGPKGKKIEVPRYERVVNLSPEQRKLLRLQNEMQTNLGDLGVSQSARLQGLLGTNLNTKGITNWRPYERNPNLKTDLNRGPNLDQSYVKGGNTAKAFSEDRQRVEDAMMTRYNTQAALARDQQDTALAARGLTPGTQMYETAADEWNRARNDAVSQAIIGGGAEQSRLLGEARTATEFANNAAQQEWVNALNRMNAINAAKTSDWTNSTNWTNSMNTLRGQQLAEKQQLRNAPINEISALMSGSQVTVPQFQAYNAPSVSSVPIGEYIYNNYNARAQQAQAGMSGLFGLGSALLGGMGSAGGVMPFFAGLSDRRVKTDIERIPGNLAGLPIYSFRFIDGLGLPEGDQVGVMADEVREVYPQAVHTGDDGLDRVDYAYLSERIAP